MKNRMSANKLTWHHKRKNKWLWFGVTRESLKDRRGNIWGLNRSVLGTCVGRTRRGRGKVGRLANPSGLMIHKLPNYEWKGEQEWRNTASAIAILHIGTYCIHTVLQIKKPSLKIKLVLLMVKMSGFFHSWENGKNESPRFSFFLLSIITNPSASLLPKKPPSPFCSTCYAEGWIMKSYSNSIPTS